MKIMMAPDSYKGSMRAIEVAHLMEQGARRVYPHAEIILVPMADGGEGTLDALVGATNGKIFYKQVMGPLGAQVAARWGLLGDRITAVIEMAEASGITLVPADKLNPLLATTYGTGELISSALDHGCTRLILCLGGSATNDGGAGMASALGVKFLDEMEKELELGGAALQRLAMIDASGLDKRLRDVEVLAASDVDNPLCGPQGASAVYGPQKGATPLMVQQLDAALLHYSHKIKEQFGMDVAETPGAGAAGGMGAGLITFLRAVLVPGVNLVLDTVGFDEKVADVDLVFTGEGRTDKQSVFGKVPLGVALRAKKRNIPVICLSGSLEDGYRQLAEFGITAFFSIIDGPLNLHEAIKRSRDLIPDAVENILRVHCASNKS